MWSLLSVRFHNWAEILPKQQPIPRLPTLGSTGVRVRVFFFRFPRDSMKTTTAALFFLKSHKLLKCAKPGSQTNIYPDTPQKCGIRTIIFPSNRSTAFVPEFKQSIKGNKGGVTSPRTPWSFLQNTKYYHLMHFERRCCWQTQNKHKWLQIELKTSAYTPKWL